MTWDITKIEHKIIKDPALNVVLYQPEIPANTGNIARLCGAAMIRLHLIHPLGFRVDDRHLKRAGLDYWQEVDVRHHNSFYEFLESDKHGIDRGLISFSKYADDYYTTANVDHGYYLLFGQESHGLPVDIREKYPCYKVPIWGSVRSLNLATTVGIVVYHYLYKINCFR